MARRACCGVVLVALLAFAPAAGAAAKLRVQTGRLAPNGTALVTGKLARGARLPRSLVLSKDARYSRGDVEVGALVKKGKGGSLRAWVSVPEGALAGRMQLLGCAAAKPTRRSCKSLGKLRVAAGAALRVATPVLDQARAVATTIDFRGGSVTATAADGTTFTLTIPANTTPAIPVELTPVTALNPTGGVGTLSDGVMIAPIGEAPPGSTLAIHPAVAPAVGSRVMAFGGADPSEAAFLLPLKPSATTTIQLSAFGGYGIAAAPSAKASAARAVVAGRVACTPSASGGGAGGARTAAAGQRPIVSCITAAQVKQQWTEAVIESNYNPKVVEEGSEAVSRAVEQEAAPIFAQAPTEEGAAEIQQLLSIVGGLGRQSQLAGLGARLINGFYEKAFAYEDKLYERLCKTPNANSAVFYDYAAEILATAAQEEHLSAGSGAKRIAQAEECVSQVHLRLSASDEVANHYALQGSGMQAAAKLHVSGVEIVEKKNGQGWVGYSLQPANGDPQLAFDSTETHLESPPAGVSAAITATTGTLQLAGAMQLGSHRQVRCDKNRRLIVEHFVYLVVEPYKLWGDGETVTVSDTSVNIPYPFGFAAGAWDEAYPNKGLTTPANLSKSIVLRMSPTSPGAPDKLLGEIGREAVKAASGQCSTQGFAINECSSYSFNAKFEGEALPH